METFLEMGGYGAFVWPAYGVTVAVMFGLWLDSFLGLRRRRRALTQLEAELPQARRRRERRQASGQGTAVP